MTAPAPIDTLAVVAAALGGDFARAHEFREALHQRGLMLVPIRSIEDVQAYLRAQRELREIGLSPTEAAAAIDIPSVPEAPSDEAL